LGPESWSRCHSKATLASHIMGTAVDLFNATRSADWTRAEELLKNGTSVDYDIGGAGSTFFNAVRMNAPMHVFELFLAAPGIGRVLNGTVSSWLPLATAFVHGNTDMIMPIMDHPNWKPTETIPWQLESFVVRDSVKFSKHPDTKSDCDYTKLLGMVETLFTRSCFGQSYAEWYAAIVAWHRALFDLIPEHVSYEQFKELVTRIQSKCLDAENKGTGAEDFSWIDAAFEEKATNANGMPCWTKEDVLEMLKEFIGGDEELDPDDAKQIVEACFSRIVQVNETEGQLLGTSLDGAVLVARSLESLKDKKVGEVLSVLRDGCRLSGGKVHYVLAGGQLLENVDQDMLFVDLPGFHA